MSDNIISENFSKNKLGRPRVHSKERLEIYKKMWPEIRSERGLIEIEFMINAYKVIKREYESDKIKNVWCEYYIDPKGIYVFHKSILAALGRCCEQDILDLGHLVAEEKLPASNAIKFIRRNRRFCVNE